MTKILALVAALTAVQDDSDPLSEAAREASNWTSYIFSVTETVEGAKRGNDPIQGVWVKEGGIRTKAGNSESILIPGKRASKRKDGTWSAKATSNPITPPQAFLEDLEKNFKSVTRTDEAGSTVYTGDLTAAGRAFLMRGLTGRIPTDGGNARFIGKVWVDASDRIFRVEAIGTWTGQIKGQDASITASRVVTFDKINGAELSIPEEARAAFDQLP